MNILYSRAQIGSVMEVPSAGIGTSHAVVAAR